MDYLKEVEKHLDLPSAEKEQVMREIASHYNEVIEELVDSGKSEEDAYSEAARRLGDPADIASRMQVVHCQATWKGALLAAVPFLIGPLLIPMILLMKYFKHEQVIGSIILGCILLTFIWLSFRELRRGRRPLWLATWLGACISILHGEILGPVIALWIFRRSKIWFSVIFLLIIVRALGYFLIINKNFAMSGLVLLGIGFLSIHITNMVLAIKLFTFHPYGSVRHAPLFLFSVYTVSLSPKINTEALSDAYIPYILLSLIAPVTVLLYARASKWQQKTRILSWGAFFTSVIVPLTYLPGFHITYGPVSLETHFNPDLAGTSGVAFVVAITAGLFRWLWITIGPSIIADTKEGLTQPLAYG